MFFAFIGMFSNKLFSFLNPVSDWNKCNIVTSDKYYVPKAVVQSRSEYWCFEISQKLHENFRTHRTRVCDKTVIQNISQRKAKMET